MRFKGIKIGKLIGKGEKHEEEEADTPTAKEIEERGQTGGEESPETVGEKSPEAAELSLDEEMPIKPHGPLQELSLDSAGELDDGEYDEAVNDSIMPEEDAEPIKLVELKTETDELAGEESVGLDTDAAAPAEEPKEKEPKPASDSFNSLFADDEEEENPLANLINSLPEVSAQEILNDITELKDIMKEGH